MLKSPKFEVNITGTHAKLIPEEIALLFIEKGHSRVAIKGFFKTSEIFFHGKIRPYQGNYILSFGNRYQKELGVTSLDFFQLQFFEDQSKYGVEMPEAFAAVLESDWDALQMFEQLTA